MLIAFVAQLKQSEPRGGLWAELGRDGHEPFILHSLEEARFGRVFRGARSGFLS